MPISEQEKFARIRLLRSGNIGPVTYFQLLARFGNAVEAIGALPGLAQRGGGRTPRLANTDSVKKEMDAADRADAAYLFHDDAEYPTLLGHMENAPPIFTYRGNIALLNRQSVAIVGARNASAAACKFARKIAHDLAQQGCVIVSGLARGIDTAAHMGAGPGSIGVIASGIDIAYPPENAELQETMANGALVIAEQPPGTEPLARHFPFRNRIIAGLSAGTLVVEAAPRSGSLITARLAGEAGRDVMAIPGSPLDPRARGCNTLIRNGATLIQSAENVLEQIGSIDERLVREDPRPYELQLVQTDMELSDTSRRTVENLLNMTAIGTDELVRQSGMPAAEVATILLELELAGRLDRHAGARVSLKP
ncbi:DNA-processing protein DprA [Sphingorhabdus sp. Alg239-R122]|uniref:DNA-processing protein DprA n=1 Tax=Sphingorhabdus sp. Alg239-R122 TaxID=2305989 RepID=UPI0013DCAB70|nr:DNA-processing protein DprA [Sphingorhabdus sp. Alg239-R122]